MTPSQAESPSAPEAIEDQRSRGGPWGTVSLLGDALTGLSGDHKAQPRGRMAKGLLPRKTPRCW